MADRGPGSSPPDSSHPAFPESVHNRTFIRLCGQGPDFKSLLPLCKPPTSTTPLPPAFLCFHGCEHLSCFLGDPSTALIPLPLTLVRLPGGSDGKKSACNAGDLGREDPLEKGTATHSGILAWKIPWTEEPRGLQSMELQRVRHD